MDRTQIRRGFTLIELLIVIIIVAVLMSIVVAVGHQVLQSGKQRMTIGAIKILEESLTEVISQNQGSPRPYLEDPRSENDGRFVQPIVDGRNFTKGENRQVIINSGGLYMAQASEFEGVKEIFSGLDSKIVKLFNPDRLRKGDKQVLTLWEHWDLPTVMDGWGNPVRYVHPAFDGLIYGADWEHPGDTEEATAVDTAAVYPLSPPLRYAFDKFRRNNEPTTNSKGPVDPDSDGGLCPGNHPYFYSAGPDGNPATIEDNVYSVVPQIQKLN